MRLIFTTLLPLTGPVGLNRAPVDGDIERGKVGTGSEGAKEVVDVSATDSHGPVLLGSAVPSVQWVGGLVFLLWHSAITDSFVLSCRNRSDLRDGHHGS